MYTPDSPLTGYRAPDPAWRDVLTAHGARPDADTILATYDLWCKRFDLDANLLLGQGCHESTYYTSDRWRDWNPAGLGVTTSDAVVKPFTSPQEGIEAHAEHICAYAYTLAECPVDHTTMADRRHTFHEGLPTVAGLEARNHWADPGIGYVDSIVAIANTVAGSDPAPPPNGGTVTAPPIIDVRGQLPTAPGQGSGQKMAAPVGLVLHYSAVHYADDADMLTLMQSEAAYHIGPYLREYSLAYHYVVDWRTGQVYQARDEDDILWHVGSWVPGGNGTGISIHVPGDADTRLTDAGLAGLLGLFDWLRAKHSIPPDMVRPHRFFGTSTCPGDYLSDLVYRYNRGEIGGGTVANAIKDPVTGKTMANAMLEYWTRTGGLDVHGRPLTEEFDGVWPDDKTKRTQQICERSVFAFFPENADPYRVQELRLGATYAAEQGFTGPGIPTLHAPPVMTGGDE